MPTTPAHNDHTEYPTPIREIRELKCINCKHECKIDDLITYTRLHDGTIIWWHRRKNQDDPDPCKVGSYVVPQVCKLCGQVLEKKRVHSNGKGFVCLTCVKVRQSDYRKNYREEALRTGDTKKKYYFKNREKILKQKRESYIPIRRS